MPRTFFSLLALLGHQVAGFGQNAVLFIGSGSAAAGSTISVPVNLVSFGEPRPAGIQWTFSYSSDISSVTVAIGASATNAGKSVSCSANKCLISGLTKDAMGNGTIATATFQIAANPSKKAIPIQIIDVIASTALGASIPASGGSGVVTLR
jgi:Cohesin domain